MRKLLLNVLVLCCVPILAVAQTFTTTMTGPGEAPAPGDADGTGIASVTIVGTTVNWTLVVRNINPPSAAHIHEAPAGTPGNVVIGFSPLNFVNGRADGSTQNADQAVINRIKANPAGFYVNVHNADFPGGAIRGQLTQGCVTNANTLCVDGNRFRVDIGWVTTQATNGMGQAIKLTSDSGYFWFFNQDNAEVVVKVLNACIDPFNRHWVFAAGLTNVNVDMTVTDTQNGTVKRYINPQETPFQPIQDTNAFACP